MIRQLSLLFSSHALLAVVGIAAVPVLFRNLGASVYGEYSAYLLLVGLLAHLDYARPILIRGMAGGVTPPHRDALSSVTAWNTLLLVVVGGALGLVLLGPWVALATALSMAFIGLALPSYSWLVSADRIGHTGLVRNTLRSGAIVAAATVSFFTVSEHGWLWLFVLAAAATCAVFRRLVVLAGAADRPPPVAWRGPAGRFSADSRDLLLFGVAMVVLNSVDRLLLKPFASEQDFGAYMGAADLVLKLNILSMALGNTLYPVLARRVRDDGVEAADRWFGGLLTRLAGWGGLAAAAGMAALAPLAALLLGPGVVPSLPLIPVFVAGVYIQLYGFLVAAWLRAHGDFAAQRRASVGGAALMLCGGILLVPAYGLAGAVATWFLGRAADLFMLAFVMQRLDATVYPIRLRRFHLLMIAALTTFAWTRFLLEVS